MTTVEVRPSVYALDQSVAAQAYHLEREAKLLPTGEHKAALLKASALLVEELAIIHATRDLVLADMISRMHLGAGALANVAETRIVPADDVQRLVDGAVTPDELLADCLDQADDDRRAGWIDYVTQCCMAAGRRRPSTI